MTPLTQPHPLSSPLTLYVYDGEGVETLAAGVHAAAGVVTRFGNHSEVNPGSRSCQKEQRGSNDPCPYLNFGNGRPQVSTLFDRGDVLSRFSHPLNS